MAAKVDWRSGFSGTQGFVLEFLTTIVFTDTATVRFVLSFTIRPGTSASPVDGYILKISEWVIPSGIAYSPWRDC